jgi:CCR4-NOT transcription complex subunit 1
LQESSPEVIHYILSRLTNEPDTFGISKDLLEDVLSCLRRDYPRELVPVILAPILYKEQGVDYTCHKMAHETNSLTKNMVETSLADLIIETGYPFTSSLEECRTNIATFGFRELSATSVARAITYMARTHTGLDEHSLRHLRNGTSQSWPEQESSVEKADEGLPNSWNMEIFVQVKEVETFVT